MAEDPNVTTSSVSRDETARVVRAGIARESQNVRMPRAEDPLADVLRGAYRRWWAEGPGEQDAAAFQADAVRAHIAGVLDAEEAKWRAPTKYPGRDARGGAQDAIARLRVALLGTTEETNGG